MNIVDIGKRVRRARRKAGLSQAELARAVGYSAANPISKLESGKFATVDIRLLYKIADVTGVTVGFLAGDSALALPDEALEGEGRPPSVNPDWQGMGQTLKHMLTLLEELLERLGRLESRVEHRATATVLELRPVGRSEPGAQPDGNPRGPAAAR